MADDANGYTADVQYEGQAQFSRGGIGSGAYGAPSGTYGAPGGTGGFQGGYQGGKYNFNCTLRHCTLHTLPNILPKI